MDTDSSMIQPLFLLLILILVNAFFAMSEIAVIGLNDARLRRQAEEGDASARRLFRLTETPSRFLSTLQVGCTLSGMFAAAVAADSLAGPVAAALPAMPLSPAALLHRAENDIFMGMTE